MGKKLKYKDVVKKAGPHHSNKKNNTFYKKNKKGASTTSKTFKSYNHKKKGKRKSSFVEDKDSVKKLKLQEQNVIVKEKDSYSTSESEEEETSVDYMKLLRESFGDKIAKVNSAPISSESEEEEEVDKRTSDVEDSNEDSEIEESLENENKSESDESDIETQQQEEEDQSIENSKDPFVKHISYELHPDLLENLQSNDPNAMETHRKSWPKLGDLIIQIPKCDIKETKKQSLLETTVYAVPGSVPKKIDDKGQLFIKSQIAPNLSHANKSLESAQDGFLTPLQQELFSIINNYQDLYYPERTFDNAQEIRFVYCLHAINHVLKTRIRVLHHNAKLAKKEDISEEFRDQGLVRPKVLIVAPFKDSAFKIINTLIDIMFKEDKGNVIKKNKFKEEYTGNELYLPKKNPKPEDYEKTFCGNIGDDFKMGITITKKSLKLYSDFYSSDIIVASPLGLRTIIGAQGEPDRDFDFLASIELLILDQTDVFFMQNWFHVLHIFDHLHLKPKDLHGTDINRVRQWCLNLWSKYYRQTLIFASSTSPYIDSLFKKGTNFAGKVKVSNKVEHGHIQGVCLKLQHVFRKFSCNAAKEMAERRFEFFVQKVLPIQRESAMKQTLIFIPSYYDYVRIRNYFKKEDLGFVQICEYTKDAKVARARDMFFHGDAHFMLYTERYHFYHRIRVKGIRHLVFYQPPTYPHFYSEMCDLMREINMNKKVGSMDNMTVTVLYTKLDYLQLAEIIGTDRAVKMVGSDRDTHMLLTETV